MRIHNIYLFFIGALLISFLYLPSRANAEQWWNNFQIYGPENLTTPELDDLIDIRALGGVLEVESQKSSYKRRVDYSKFKDNLYIGFINLTTAMNETTFAEHPELLEAAMLDIDGNKLMVKFGDTGQSTDYLCTINHPVWQDFIYEQAKALVDYGVDGIHIDTPEGPIDYIWMSNGGTFNMYDIINFNKYLSESYTQTQLIENFGIYDIENFNYREYMIADRNSVILFDDFKKFLRMATKNFLYQFKNDISTYAKEKYNKTISFTGNAYSLSSSSIYITDIFDYLHNEYAFSTTGYPPIGKTIPVYKLGRALGKTPVVFPDVYTNSDLSKYQKVSNLINIFINEAYASKGFFMIPYEADYAHNWEYEEMVTMYKHIANNKYLYSELQSFSKVAIVYSFPSAIDSSIQDFDLLYRGLCYSLLDGNIQFDVIVTGDELLLNDTFSQDSLSQYDLVFLPQMTHVSDNQLNIIFNFIDNGGTVVSWGDTGKYDLSGNETNRQELADFKKTGVHNHGNGKYITYSYDIGKEYISNKTDSIVQEITSLVRDYSDPLTYMDINTRLNVLAYTNDNRTQVTAHFINYDYDITTDQINPKGQFDISINLPDSFNFNNEYQLYLIYPNESPSLLSNFTIQNGKLTLTHPGMITSSSLVLISTNKAILLYSEVIKSLELMILNHSSESEDNELEEYLQKIEQAEFESNFLLARKLSFDSMEYIKRQNRPHILFDESHGEQNTIDVDRAFELNPEHPEWHSFIEITKGLSVDFVFESNYDNLITIDLLNKYDALIISSPQYGFSSSEINAIHRFVENGGGLFLIADAATNEAGNIALNAISNNYGITFSPYFVFSEEEVYFAFETNKFIHHSSFQGLPSLSAIWSTSLEVEAPAISVCSTKNNVWKDTNWNSIFDGTEIKEELDIVAIYENNIERIIAISDNYFYDVGYPGNLNGSFFKTALNWITENRNTPKLNSIILSKESPNHTITSGSDEQVYGTSASNRINLESGARTELLNFPGQNSIQIQTGSNLFTVSRSGSVVTFQGLDETFLKMPATTDAQTIIFNDEESRVLQIHNNQVMLDEQVITTNLASIEDNQVEEGIPAEPVK